MAKARLISDTIPNLINGISQQPATMRLASQAERQINGMSSVVDGLGKRRALKHRAKITATDVGAAFVHTIDRDTAEQYMVIVQNGAITVTDLDGVAKTVAVPDGLAYLTTTTPQSSIKAVTVADYTFLVNKDITVGKTAATSPAAAFEALVNVKLTNYGKKYTIDIDGVERANFTLPDGGVAADSLAAATDNVALELYNDLVAWGGAGFTFTLFPNAIHIQATANFEITTSDGYNGNAMVAFKNAVQHFDDLPREGPSGMVIEVKGNPSSQFDNYFVEFLTEGSDSVGGVWKETVGPGLETSLDPNTMPHLLVREPAGTFTFKEAQWLDRAVGDDDSNPFPSFVGREITDVYFHKNRLGFLADENAILSVAGDYFNMFKTTATALLDGDPIDVSTTHTKVSLLNHAIVFNSTLTLFADQVQFDLLGDPVLTPKTAEAPVTTEYDCSPIARPVAAGKSIFFAADHGDFASVREYLVDRTTDTQKADEVTAHVPKYLPAGVFKMAASSKTSVLIALAASEPTKAYVYSWFWSDDRKLQSSWSTWQFEAGVEVLNVDFVDDEAYFLTQHADGTYLQSITVTAGSKDVAGQPYETMLDRRVTEAQCVVAYDGVSDTTTFTLPYSDTDALTVVTRYTAAQARPIGQVIQSTHPTATTIVVNGDYSAIPVFIGKLYEFRYGFSEFKVREDAAGGGRQTVGTGKIGLRFIYTNHASTGYFRAEVTPRGAKDTYAYPYTGIIIGEAESTLGSVQFNDGSFRFPVGEDSQHVDIDLVNDTHFPSYFLSVEWEAMYSIRSGRI